MCFHFFFSRSMPWMSEVSEIRLAQVFWPFLKVEIIRVNTRHNSQHNLEEADTNFDTDHLIDSDSKLTLIRYDDTIKTYINHANSSCYALLYRCNDNIKKMCSLNVLSNLIFSNSIKFRLNADQSRGGAAERNEHNSIDETRFKRLSTKSFKWI